MGVFTPLRTARLPAAMLGALLPEQTTQLREIFDSFDGDHDGLLDAMEVGTVAQLCGFQMSPTEVRHQGRCWELIATPVLSSSQFVLRACRSSTW